jgi:hypothetical protein
MKTNKKAILGVLLARVVSLGVMKGINDSRYQEDFNIQQASIVLTYAAGAGEINGEMYTNRQRGLMAVSAIILWDATKVLGGCAGGLGWCPAGWIAGAGAVVTGL